MKILVIGPYIEESLIEKYNKLSRDDSQISVAAIKYTKFIEQGFKSNITTTEHLFLAPVGMYPSCKILSWNKSKINDQNYIKFINIMLIKQLSILCYLIYKIGSWSFHNRKEKRIVVFTNIYLPFQLAIPFVRIWQKVKFVSFVPDLPAFEFTYTENKRGLKKALIPLYINVSNGISSFSDFFVFITEHMKAFFPNKDFHVIEGFTDVKDEISENSLEKHNALMYAGSLFEKFGIKNLIDAFRKIEGETELWIFGSGDMVDEIKIAAKEDQRIKYFGMKPNSYVLKMQKKAKLLINPRFTHDEFTKYSFPSKLLEYLNSGTPVLTTKLKGIPIEYDEKFYFIHDESVEGMRISITNCLSKNNDELQKFGKNAKIFVNSEKNYKKQIGDLIKILSLKL
jgi:glycosyltransferase involved in cell wall biosynthesis